MKIIEIYYNKNKLCILIFRTRTVYVMTMQYFLHVRQTSRQVAYSYSYCELHSHCYICFIQCHCVHFVFRISLAARFRLFIMPVVHITSEAQFNEELANNKYCVVDFFATWCGPCKRIAPELEKLSNSDDFKNIKFLKVLTLFCNYLLSFLFLFRSRYSSCQ